MVRAVFGYLGQQVEEEILAPLQLKEPPEHRLKKWAKGVTRFYGSGGKNCLLATLVLSGGSDRFSNEIKGAFQAWIDSLTNVLKEAGFSSHVARKRAESAVGQIQGGLVVSRGLGDARHFKQVLKELPEQLLTEV